MEVFISSSEDRNRISGEGILFLNSVLILIIIENLNNIQNTKNKGAEITFSWWTIHLITAHFLVRHFGVKRDRIRFSGTEIHLSISQINTISQTINVQAELTNPTLPKPPRTPCVGLRLTFLINLQ